MSGRTPFVTPAKAGIQQGLVIRANAGISCRKGTLNNAKTPASAGVTKAST